MLNRIFRKKRNKRLDQLVVISNYRKTCQQIVNLYGDDPMETLSQREQHLITELNKAINFQNILY